MRRSPFLIVGAGAVVLAGVMLPASAKGAPAVACGDTVTTDVVLMENLTCQGDGLIVGADDVTIDLNGRRLTGSGSGTGLNLRDWVVTVVNGSVSKFEVAVQAGRYAYPTSTGIEKGAQRISGVTISSSAYGVLVRASGLVPIQGTTISSSVFRSNGVAVDVEQQTPLTITDSRFQDNGRGVKAFACAPCAITNNSFTGGDVGLEFLENYWPLTVRGNSIIGAGVGIALSQGLGGPGPKVIANNTMKYNDSSGLVVRAWRFSSPPPRLEVIGNVFKNNGYNPSDPWLGSGPTAGHPLTAGAWANYGYFAGNTAIANAGYGIEGIDNPGSVGDGVVDGGGNIARANGGDPQCLGLVCSSKP